MANSPKTKLGSASVKQPVAGKSRVPSTPKSPTPPTPKKAASESEREDPWIAKQLLANMQRDGIPLTRENYLARAFGDPDYEVSPEEQFDLPVRWRDPRFR